MQASGGPPQAHLGAHWQRDGWTLQGDWSWEARFSATPAMVVGTPLSLQRNRLSWPPSAMGLAHSLYAEPPQCNHGPLEGHWM